MFIFNFFNVVGEMGELLLNWALSFGGQFPLFVALVATHRVGTCYIVFMTFFLLKAGV